MSYSNKSASGIISNTKKFAYWRNDAMSSVWLLYLLPFLLGLASGLLGSIIFWWFFNFKIVPKVEFSEGITRHQFKYNPNGEKYAFKMRNVGKRTIIDVELFAKLKVKGLHTEHPDNYQDDYIPLGDKRLPKIEKHLKDAKGILITILEDDFIDFKTSIYPKKIQDAIKNGTIKLEDLLALGTDKDNTGKNATLQIIAFGFDEISGTRKMLKSKEYTSADIHEGVFEENSLQIEPCKCTSCVSR